MPTNLDERFDELIDVTKTRSVHSDSNQNIVSFLTEAAVVASLDELSVWPKPLRVLEPTLLNPEYAFVDFDHLTGVLKPVSGVDYQFRPYVRYPIASADWILIFLHNGKLYARASTWASLMFFGDQGGELHEVDNFANLFARINTTMMFLRETVDLALKNAEIDENYLEADNVESDDTIRLVKNEVGLSSAPPEVKVPTATMTSNDNGNGQAIAFDQEVVPNRLEEFNTFKSEVGNGKYPWVKILVGDGRECAVFYAKDAEHEPAVATVVLCDNLFKYTIYPKAVEYLKTKGIWILGARTVGELCRLFAEIPNS